MKGSAIQRVVGALLGALLLFGLVISMLSGEASKTDRSVSADHPGGRHAALLILQELGLDSAAWHAAPVFLPRDESLLWMPKMPTSMDFVQPGEKSDGPEPEPASLRDDDPRHPLNYGEFVRAGGTLLLPYSEDHQRWLREDCGLQIPDWSAPVLALTDELELESGEVLKVHMESAGHAASGAFDEDAYRELGWRDVAWRPGGRPFISWVSVGYGRVAYLANDSFLTNALLADFDNGVLLTRIAEALGGSGELLFDEFALGIWTPRSKTELLLAPGWIEVSLHALLAALLFIAVHAWLREYPRDARPVLLRPLLRVQSEATLLTRARRFDLLALDLRLGVALRVARRFGVRHPDSQWSSSARLKHLIQALAERAPAGLEALGWKSLLNSSDVHNRAGLEKLGQDLRVFEERATALASHRPLAKRPS